MKITKIHIDGYGAFDDCTIDPLHPGLSIIFGQNEAGKSTLLDFVRGVLFGFADGRSPRAQHRPLRGGRHGGRLVVTDANGSAWTIERYAGKAPTITSASGEQVSETFLRDLLGHTDKQVFESIFAFGLDELGQVERLHDDSVRDLIFSAGVLGAGRSASTAIKQLEDQRSEITRNPRSEDQKSRLHRLAKRRTEIESELRTAKQNAKAFERLTRDIAGERRLAESALAELLQLQERKKELADLEFANSSLVRKAELERRLAQCRQLSEDEQSAYNERRSIEEFIVRFDAYSQNKADLQVKIRQEETRQERIGELLPDIGIDRQTCARANVSIATTSAVEDLVASYQTGQAEIGLLTNRLSEIEHDYAGKTRQLNEAAKGRDPSDADRLQHQREGIRTLRSMVSELREREHAVELRRQAATTVASSRPHQIPAGGLLFSAVALLGAIFIILSFVDASHGRALISTATAGALVLIVGIVGLVLYNKQHTNLPTTTEQEADSRSEDHLLLASHIVELASTLGLPEHPAEGQIEAKDRSISNELDEAREIAQLARDVHETQTDLQDTADKLHRAEEHLRDLVLRSSAIGRQLGIVQEITPHALLETLIKINEVKKLLDADRRSVGPMADHARHLAEYEALIAGLFLRCGIELPHPEAIEHRLKELAQQCNEIERIITVRDGLHAEILAEENRLTALLHRDGDRLYKELEVSSPVEREAELARIFLHEESAKTTQSEHFKRGQELQSVLSNLQGSTSIGDLELELESATAEIATILHRWSLLGLSSLLLKRTLQRYETERQPAVIARAGELFSQVTEGRYDTLIAREDAQGHRNLEVICHDGSTIEAQFLSKGTAEQLYLCVRLAYAENFAERSVALPLVLDDVLVNFDAVRTQQMARAITTVAKDHQVLVFTCHPHMVNLFKTTTSNLSVIELNTR